MTYTQYITQLSPI